LHFIDGSFTGRHNDPDYQKAVELTEKQESKEAAYGYGSYGAYKRGRGRGRGISYKILSANVSHELVPLKNVCCADAY